MLFKGLDFNAYLFSTRLSCVLIFFNNSLNRQLFTELIKLIESKFLHFILKLNKMLYTQ